MNEKYDFRRVTEELWKVASQDRKSSDPSAVLEHLLYLLYFKVSTQRNDNLWNGLLNILKDEGAGRAGQFYQEELKRTIEWQFGFDLKWSLYPFSPNVFERIVFILDKYFDNNFEFRLGDVFELLVEKAYSQNFGFILTPRLLAKSMAKLLIDHRKVPYENITICDPACGTGTLLVSFVEQFHVLYQRYSSDVQFQQSSSFVGFEINTGLSRLAQLNLFLRGLPYMEIHNEDSLALPELQHREKFDYVITNPPITKRYGDMDIPMWYSMGNHYSKNGTRSYEFIELALSLLKREGRCAIIVPEGMLSSNIRYDVDFRSNLLLNFQIDGIVSLPAGILPGTGMKTSILLISNRRSLNRQIWFYEFDQKPNQVRNDERLWDDLTDLWRAYVEFEQIPDANQDHVWITSYSEIEKKQFQLAASAYRKRLVNRKYFDPNRLINEIRELEWGIKDEMDELYRMHFKEQSENFRVETDFKEVVTTTAEADLKTVKNVIGEHLSEKQKALFNIFMDAKEPLAIHEAAKLVNNNLNKSTKLGVQEAKQITELLNALGLIESVSSSEMLYPKQSSNESNRIINFQDPLKIVLWKRATNLRRD
ncbi:N-6 DNA methylase [Neobacillus sp. SuZ13]|uniref:HsdM family class I SAM-dependent methyltransferase n=1 Tax=Neobacillus sp. SuZ13 TaxID=3047875 RepID=UPI0024BFF101|nr:N-6 DNA methylase [Neobacillus sp. SuZ13]WHY65011.1 N-6 DNA methylase [Neobacillus sp. SuZ13]